MISIQNITISSKYGTILENVSLQFEAGSISCLFGASGAGKSVLLHSLLYGLPKNLQQNGTIKCAPCFLVPQDINESFNPTKKILAQLPKSAKVKIQKFLQELQLNLSYKDLNKYPHAFSQGELQRLSILLALVQNTTTILMDEPTAFLDENSKQSLALILQKLQGQGYTFLITTHDMLWARQIASNYYNIQDKKIIPHIPLLASHLVNLNNFQLVPARKSYEHLSLSNGQVTLVKKTILQNISYNLQQGEVLAIMGASGVGKTSLAKAIAGCDSYKLIGVQGVTIKVNYVSQNYSAALTPHLLVKDNLLIILKACGVRNWYRNYKTILRLCQQLNLASSLLKKYPAELSLGEKQRFILLRSLLPYVGKAPVKPVLLILDEITSSLNFKNQAAVIKLLKTFLPQYKVTCILITHNPMLVNALAHKYLHILNSYRSNFYEKII